MTAKFRSVYFHCRPYFRALSGKAAPGALSCGSSFTWPTLAHLPAVRGLARCHRARVGTDPHCQRPPLWDLPVAGSPLSAPGAALHSSLANPLFPEHPPQPGGGTAAKPRRKLQLKQVRNGSTQAPWGLTAAAPAFRSPRPAPPSEAPASPPDLPQVACRQSRPPSRRARCSAGRRGGLGLQHPPPTPAPSCPALPRRDRRACALPGAWAVQAPPESKRVVPGAGTGAACAEGVCMWAGVYYYYYCH